MASAGIVVVGGGVFGTSAAFHLAAAGHSDILVLDRGPVACGTTPNAAGQTGYLNVDPVAHEFGRYNVGFFENFAERTGQSIDFRQVGSLRIALTGEFQANLEARLAASETSDGARFLDHQETRELVPGLQPPEDCRVLHIPRDGYVEPKSVAVAYAKAAAERGVRFQTGVAVHSLEATEGRIHRIITSEGPITADWVVLAAGAWTRQLARTAGLNVPSIPVRHQAYVTAPIASVLTSQPIVRVTEPQIYVRHEAGGLLVGGYGYRPLSFDMDDFCRDFEIAALPPDRIYYEQLRQAASKFFPDLNEAVTIQERRGLPTISPDGHIIVAEPDGVRGLVLVTACGVGGIDRSPGVGRIVADIVRGDEPWIAPDRLRVDRFGDVVDSDVRLRSQCETVYAHHYHDIY